MSALQSYGALEGSTPRELASQLDGKLLPIMEVQELTGTSN